ncbi:MAG: hypothetical protein QHH26_09755 [Armatimonadota bacterium]|nr:hypothetical protein [Armatimonadota bacterium]
MNEVIYDMSIKEASEILEKSDRQIRRYVKANRLKARPVRVDGHIKLMFNREQVLNFKETLMKESALGESDNKIMVDAKLINKATDGESEKDETAVIDGIASIAPDHIKYVIDTLLEQIKELRAENRELHYQLEQRSGQVGFLQGRVETLQEELKMLAPAPKTREEITQRKPWYRKIFGG